MQEKYDQLLLRNSSGSDDAATSEPSVNDMALWLEATGGAKKGRVLGMGSLSRTCRLSGLSSSGQTPVRAELMQMNQELSHMKELLAQKDNELQVMRVEQQRRDNEIQAMRVEQLRRDNEFEEFRAQQRLIMQHLQLVSASSSIPPSLSPPNDGDDDFDIFGDGDGDGDGGGDGNGDDDGDNVS